MSEAIVNVEFFDTTLRDGAQSLPANRQFREGRKPVVADVIAAMEGGIIEGGMPTAKGDFARVQAVARTVGNTAYEVKGWRDTKEVDSHIVYPEIAGLSRCLPGDVELTWSAVMDAARPRIHTFISTDPEHMSFKFPDKTPEEVLEMGRSAVRLAKELTSTHDQARVEFSAEAASTTDEAYLEKVIRTAIDEGADVVNLPDTVGQRHPFFMRQAYLNYIDWVVRTNPDVVISSHNHNDLGMAAANSLALVMAAADYAAEHQQPVGIQIETTICGLGERAGNADVFPVIGSLFKFSAESEFAVPVEWKFNPVRAVMTARSVMAETRTSFERFVDFWRRSPRDMVNRQNPIVGHDIMAHRSGIHSDGVIKGGYQIYTPFAPTFWGHPEDARHEEGKYQGAKGRRVAAASRSKA